VVWMLMLGHGSMSFASGFLLVMTASLLLTSVRELLAGNKQNRELRNRVSTQDLLDRKDSPAASITETTTRRLKSRTLGNSRKDI